MFDAAQKKAVEAVGGVIPKKMQPRSERELPQGVYKKPSGKFVSAIQWGGKRRYIGSFDNPEQASAAYMSVRKDLEDDKEVDAVLDEARKNFSNKKKSKAMSTRDLPTGVYKTSSGKFGSSIWWGSKHRHIGTFDTPEQASAAFMAMKKDLEDAKLSVVDVEEVDAIFNAAKTKAQEGRSAPKNQLPTGVSKKSSGKFRSTIRWGRKRRTIGTFDTPEQASAAYEAVLKELDNAKLSVVGAEEITAVFDAAKTKVLESLGGFVPEESDLPRGVSKVSTGNFVSQLCWGRRTRRIRSNKPLPRICP